MPFGLFRLAPSSTQLIRERNYAEALAAADRALARHPRAMREWMNKGVTLAFLGQYEEALEAFKHVQGVAARVGFWSVELQALFALKHFDEAFELAQRSLYHNPQAGWEWNDMGVALANLNRREEALACFERSVAIDARNSYVWVNLGASLRSLGLNTQALDADQHALAIKPDNAAAWSNRGLTLLRLNQHVEALRFFEHALELEPSNAVVWGNKGDCLLAMMRHDEALTACRRSLDLGARTIQTWQRLGTVLHEMERYDDALDACEQALQLNPTLVIAWVNKADYLRHLRRFDEALSAIERGRQLDQRSAAVESMAGRILSDQGHYEEAAATFDRALALDPNRRNTWVALGDLHMARQEYEQALVAFERALAIGPVSEGIAENRDAALRALERDAGVGTAPPMPAPDPLANWTAPARRALELARQEARQLGASEVGDEHLLLGLLGVPEGMAAHVLGGLGVQLGTARDAVSALPARPSAGAAGPATADEIGLARRAQDSIATAVTQARELKQSYVATQHLLLALALLKGGRSHDAWLLLRIKPTKVHEATLSAMSPW